LRDRVPGVYELAISSSFALDITRLYVFGEDVALLRLAGDDVLVCPTVSEWGRASSCALAASEYFAACLEPQADGDDCVLMLDAWVSDCVEALPACG
jgi:hypothetical protein